LSEYRIYIEQEVADADDAELRFPALAHWETVDADSAEQACHNLASVPDELPDKFIVIAGRYVVEIEPARQLVFNRITPRIARGPKEEA
jgi:hypothetical protein